MSIGLGLDTGGTYTDAVLMDLEEGRVLSKSKSMTTYEDLCVGIESAIDLLDGSLMDSVGVVALSSTLATNSIVEGRGCRVGLVCIGRDYDGTLAADHCAVVPGGHDIHGDETEPLDEDQARTFLESIRGKVQGLAVSGYLSVRNPSHEQRVKEMARGILGVPVICGHELTSELGFNERTTTCIMNSRLIRVMDDLIRSVRTALDERGVRAPLMISRGDGTMMRDAVARERPVETILSGPAASLMGAMHLTGLADAVVVDMGGTTTDIGILRGGHPGLDREGAVIGGKRTRVMAARIYTSGIGGDSRIVPNRGQAVLTPQRVVPLCVAAARWPEVADALASLPRRVRNPMTRPLGRPDLNVLDSEFLRTVGMPPEGYGFTRDEMEFLRMASRHPCTLSAAVACLGCGRFDIRVDRMEAEGLVQRIGFTPTDVLHCTGEYTSFDVQASEAGAEHLAALAGVSRDAFLSMCRRAVRDKVCGEIMRALVTEDSGEPDMGPTGELLMARAVAGEPCRDFSVSVRLSKPIVGIGAPSGVYLKWAAEALGADLVVSGDSDVGNAIGAVCSSVSESLKVLIRPMIPRRRDARYEAFSRLGRWWFMTMEEAMEVCEARAREHVTAAAEESGADVVEVTVDVERNVFMYSPEGPLHEVEMTVNAAGRPRIL